jgi:hypothetical protein
VLLSKAGSALLTPGHWPVLGLPRTGHWPRQGGLYVHCSVAPSQPLESVQGNTLILLWVAEVGFVVG